MIRKTHLAPRLAKWQLPDKVVFTESIALSSVGKADKTRICVLYHDLYTSDTAR